MAQLKDVLYTAEATATGGRKGHARTSDGRLDLELSRPKEFKGEGGPGTNPEQLFAVGYAACFQSAMESVARAKEIDVTGNEVTSHVSIGPIDGGGYGIAAELIVSLPSLDHEAAEKLVEQAHQRCPYSRATRGNIEVDITVKSG